MLLITKRRKANPEPTMMYPKKESIFLPVDLYNMTARAYDADHVSRSFPLRQKGAHLKVHSACSVWAVESLESLAELAGYEARYIATTEFERTMATDRAERCRKAVALIKAAFPDCCR